MQSVYARTARSQGPKRDFHWLLGQKRSQIFSEAYDHSAFSAHPATISTNGASCIKIMRFQLSPRFPFLVFLCAILVTFSASAIAQEPAPPASSLTQAAASLRPVLLDMAHALASLNIKHWKAPGAVRSACQADADSIQRDMNGTLPGLVEQSNAAPTSVSASFALYRNLDALYDVLLRLTETAVLTAPRIQAGNLQYALTRLESARKGIGDAIFTSAKDHDAELARLQTAVRSAEANRKPVPVTVVNDGPVRRHHSSRRHSKKKTTPAPKSSGKANAQPPK